MNPKELEDLQRTQQAILRAFPKDKDGNPDLSHHRDYHDAQIEAAEEQKEFWSELKGDLAKKGLWALVTIGAGAAVTAVGYKFGVMR